jgi:hypothetical protein
MKLRWTKGTRNNKPDYRLYVNGIIRMRIRRIGLGDIVHFITRITFIEYIWKKINPNCNCERRKQEWNKIKL